MYVRWKSRPLTRTAFRERRPAGGRSLTAVLVESRRVNGKPRQRFVAHLATLQVWDGGRGEMAICGGRAHRAVAIGFWQRVLRRLEGVQADFDRRRVEVSIAAVVPRPGE